MALGIFIFVVLFGFGNGLKNQFKEFFWMMQQMCLQFFLVKRPSLLWDLNQKRQIRFENSDLSGIKENFTFFLENISPEITRYAQVTYKLESNNYRTKGVSPSEQFFEKNIVTNGRYINSNDVKNKEKYAVIGRLVVQDLFKPNENPVGKFINIDSSVFKVIGVFKDLGGDNEERVVVIPYTTRQLIEKNNSYVDQIRVSYKESLDILEELDLKIS